MKQTKQILIEERFEKLTKNQKIEVLFVLECMDLEEARGKQRK